MRIFPTLRIFNPVNRGLAFIGRKCTDLKNRWLHDWRDTSVYNFGEFISNLASVLFWGSVIVNLLSSFTAMGIGTVVAQVWVGYVLCTLVLPSFFIGLVLFLWYHFYLRGLDNDVKWWTSAKARKWSHLFARITVYLFVAYVLGLVLVLLSMYSGTLFIPAVAINVVALKNLLIGLYWLPVCLLMPLASWTGMTLKKFELDLTRYENHILRSRDDNVYRGSMSDWSNDDELLDYKLERLGL